MYFTIDKPFKLRFYLNLFLKGIESYYYYVYYNISSNCENARAL